MSSGFERDLHGVTVDRGDVPRFEQVAVFEATVRRQLRQWASVRTSEQHRLDRQRDRRVTRAAAHLGRGQPLELPLPRIEIAHDGVDLAEQRTAHPRVRYGGSRHFHTAAGGEELVDGRTQIRNRFGHPDALAAEHRA